MIIIKLLRKENKESWQGRTPRIRFLRISSHARTLLYTIYYIIRYKDFIFYFLAKNQETHHHPYILEEIEIYSASYTS